MTTTGMTIERAHREGLELVQHHTDRFLTYLGSLDGDATAAPVPGSAWTVGQVVAHVQSLFLRYTVDRRRVGDRTELAARNADDVEALGVDVESAIESIRAQLDLLRAIGPSVDPGAPHPFQAGQTITAAGGWGNLLGELLAHGDDLARATGTPFGIPSADLEVLWRFTAPVLQAWLRAEAADHRDRWRLEFPFGPIDVTFDGGRLRWGDHEHDGRPDHVLEIDDAAEFALRFPYRRRPITDAPTALLAARFHDL